MNQPSESEIDDPLAVYQHSWYRKFGNCYGCSFTSSGNPRILIGPHWPLCLCLLTSIILIGTLVIVEIAVDISHWAVGTGIVVVGGCVVFLCAAASVNPGLVMKKEGVEANADSRAFCLVCEITREPGTVHCQDCDVCIRGFDHHCPWTGKCIGSGNLPYFYGFLLCILSCALYIVICSTFKSAGTHGLRGKK